MSALPALHCLPPCGSQDEVKLQRCRAAAAVLTPRRQPELPLPGVEETGGDGGLPKGYPARQTTRPWASVSACGVCRWSACTKQVPAVALPLWITASGRPSSQTYSTRAWPVAPSNSASSCPAGPYR